MQSGLGVKYGDSRQMKYFVFAEKRWIQKKVQHEWEKIERKTETSNRMASN